MLFGNCLFSFVEQASQSHNFSKLQSPVLTKSSLRNLISLSTIKMEYYAFLSSKGESFVLNFSQVLYLLQLYQNSQEGTAHFTSLTECILAQPMLSYSLYHTKATKKSSHENETDNENGEDGNDEDDDHNESRNTSDFDHNGAQDDIDHDDVSDMLGDTSRGRYLVSLKMFGIHIK